MLPISIIPIFFQDPLLTEQSLNIIYIGKRTWLLTNKRIERRTKLIHIRFPLQFYFFSGSAPSNPRAPIVSLKVKQQQCAVHSTRKANTCGFDGGMAIMVQVEVCRIPNHQSGKENGALFRGSNSLDDNNNAPFCLIQFV